MCCKKPPHKVESGAKKSECLSLFLYISNSKNDLSKLFLLTPAVDGWDGIEDTVVCWVATEDDRCCGSSVVFACL